MSEDEYRSRILKSIVTEVVKLPHVLAIWEGGSAANGGVDKYSDLDLCILSDGSADKIVETIEYELNRISKVTHTWSLPRSPWGEGMCQKVFVLEDAPKHFFVDLSIFDQSAKKLISDFLEVERRGKPVVYFDKLGQIKSGSVDRTALKERHKKRIERLKQSFPIYKTLVLKELDRGHAIDGIAFFHNGIIRSLVEILGIIHRPLQFDFGFRYVHKNFPTEFQELIVGLSYTSDMGELYKKTAEAELVFNVAIDKAENSLRTH